MLAIQYVSLNFQWKSQRPNPSYYCTEKNLRLKTTIITRPKTPIIYCKRTMLKATKAFLYNLGAKDSITQQHLYKAPNRNFATATNWTYRVRNTPPLKKNEIKPNLIEEYDKFTGFKIMHPKDLSGKNHILLSDETFKSDDFYLIYGCFTSSHNLIEGILPEKVSDYQFTLKKKDQYFLKYLKPCVIPKEHAKQAKLDIFSSNALKEIKPLNEEEQLAKETLQNDLKKLLATLTPVQQDLY